MKQNKNLLRTFFQGEFIFQPNKEKKPKDRIIGVLHHTDTELLVYDVITGEVALIGFEELVGTKLKNA